MQMNKTSNLPPIKAQDAPGPPRWPGVLGMSSGHEHSPTSTHARKCCVVALMPTSSILSLHQAVGVFTFFIYSGGPHLLMLKSTDTNPHWRVSLDLACATISTFWSQLGVPRPPVASKRCSPSLSTPPTCNRKVL